MTTHSLTTRRIFFGSLPARTFAGTPVSGSDASPTVPAVCVRLFSLSGGGACGVLVRVCQIIVRRSLVRPIARPAAPLSASVAGSLWGGVNLLLVLLQITDFCRIRSKHRVDRPPVGRHESGSCGSCSRRCEKKARGCETRLGSIDSLACGLTA